MRRRKEIVTARRIRRELTSERFLKGLERAIEITHQTGRESGFKIMKVFDKKWFAYPFQISIGSSHQTGWDVWKEIEKSAREIYEKETGKKLSEERSNKEYEEFHSFCQERNLHVTETFPNWQNMCDMRKSGVTDMYLFNFPRLRYYTFFDLHTHPYTLAPSLGDLQYLNERRRQNQDEVGIALSPIMITPVVNKLHEHLGQVPVMFYQEKSPSPLNESEMAKARFEFDFLYKIWLSKSPEEKLIDVILGSVKEREVEEVKNCLPYNFHVAHFDSQQKSLNVGKEFNKFEIREK